MGNPISCSDGVKSQNELIYSGKGPDPLSFSLNYQSQTAQAQPSQLNGDWLPSLGPKVVAILGIPNAYAIEWPNGTRLLFTNYRIGEIYRSHSPTVGILTNIEVSWRYTSANGAQYNFSSGGGLTSNTDTSGIGKTYQLITSGPAEGKPSVITNAFGKSLSIQYDAQGNPSTVTDPAQQQYLIYYDTQNRLQRISYPGTPQVSRRYHYEEVNFPQAMTGITDENNIRFATWGYDAQGRAISSEHAGAVEATTLQYIDDLQTRVRRYRTLTEFNEIIYKHTRLNGASVLTEKVYSVCVDCTVGNERWIYDSSGHLKTYTDKNGHKIDYTHNTRGLETSRTEAFGTAQARTISTTWHPDFRLPTRSVATGKTTQSTFDVKGNLLTRTESDTTVTPNVSRTTTFTYNSLGQVLTQDGTRTDVNDIITYEYNIQDDLIKVTNALGHITLITAYDPHGNPLSITDANGVVTTMSYDARQRLLTRTVAAGTSNATSTRFEYDAVGNLTKIIQLDTSLTD